MLYLSHEFFKLKGKKITISVGQPILTEELNAIKNDKKIANSIKEKVYALN
jgi:hypothetical protein